jgi:hypothetical protein
LLFVRGGEPETSDEDEVAVDEWKRGRPSAMAVIVDEGARRVKRKKEGKGKRRNHARIRMEPRW